MEQLIRLQNIDTKLKDLNDLLGDLPSKVEDLNNQEESTKDSITSKKSRSKELDVEINKTELDVSALIGKIDKLKDQLFLVTNNKQYDALMTEIDHLKEKRTGSENKLIELMEEKESIIERIKIAGKNSKISVQRFKGLGEMNPSQLRETTMNADTRRLVQLTLDSNENTNHLMDMLLSKKRSPDRRVWLEDKGNLANVS